MNENKKYSLTEIANKINKSSAYVSDKISKYNKIENEIKGTYSENYFYKYEKVENAEYIRIIKFMILFTIKMPVLPLLSDKDLMNYFKTTNSIVDKYIFYILNNSSKNEYFHKLPDEIKKQIS